MRIFIENTWLMSTTKKSSFATNLDQIGVFITDTDPASRYFKVTQLNETLTGGKNAFLIQGSERLRDNTYIYIEIKDANGDVIYNEPASGIGGDYYEGLSIPVSVRVYDDTAFGPATVTIVGELKQYIDENGLVKDIPDEWIGRINVKWQRTINVDPFKPNTSPIRFYRRPQALIQEVLLPVYDRTSTLKKYSGSFKGVAIDPISDTQWPYTKPIRYEIFSIDPSSASFNAGFNFPSKNPTKLNNLSVNTNFTATNILLKTAETNQSFATPVNWNTTIKKIISPYRAIVDIPYISKKTNIENSKIKNIELGKFELTYESASVRLSDILSSSYAAIKLDDLDTFSGDVHRVKIFAKSRNDLSGYSLLEDIVLENREALQVNFFKGQLNRRIGVFDDREIYDKYWATSSLTVPPPAGVWSPEIQIEVPSNTYLLDAIRYQCIVDYENREDIPGVGILYNSQSIEFIKDYEYKLTFNAVFTRGSFLFNDISLGSWGDPVETIVSRGYIDIYVSGSAVDEDGEPLLTTIGGNQVNLPVFNNSNEFNVGKKIGSLRANTFRRFDDQIIKFKADRNGPGTLLFYIKSGIWEINDISITPAQETAFNPSEFIIITKPNIQIPNEQFDFRFEFFDINYTAVPIVLERVIRFGGGNDILPSIVFRNVTTGVNNQLSYVADDASINGEQIHARFIASTNSLDASPNLIQFRADTNRVVAPFQFLSSSNFGIESAYDRDGNKINPEDIMVGEDYPGHIDIVGIIPQITGQDVFRVNIEYADFQKRIKNDNNGKYRLVDRITYRVYDDAGKLVDADNPGKLTVVADWQKFKPCDPAIIDPTTVRHHYGDEEASNYILKLDRIYFEAENFPGLISNRPWDEWIVWWSPQNSNDWYYGYNITNATSDVLQWSIGGGLVFTGFGSICVPQSWGGSLCGYSNQPPRNQSIRFLENAKLIVSGTVSPLSPEGRNDILWTNVQLEYTDTNTNSQNLIVVTQSMWYNSVEPLTVNPMGASWNYDTYAGTQRLIDRAARSNSINVRLAYMPNQPTIFTNIDPTSLPKPPGWIRYQSQQPPGSFNLGGYWYTYTLPTVDADEEDGYFLQYATTYNTNATIDNTPPKTGINIFLPTRSLSEAGEYIDLRISKRCHGFLTIDNDEKDPNINPYSIRHYLPNELFWTFYSQSWIHPSPTVFDKIVDLRTETTYTPTGQREFNFGRTISAGISVPSINVGWYNQDYVPINPIKGPGPLVGVNRWNVPLSGYALPYKSQHRLFGITARNLPYKSGYIVACIEDDPDDSFLISDDIFLPYSNELEFRYDYSYGDPYGANSTYSYNNDGYNNYFKILKHIPNNFQTNPTTTTEELVKVVGTQTLINELRTNIKSEFQSKFPGKKIAVIPFRNGQFEGEVGFRLKRNLSYSNLTNAGTGQYEPYRRPFAGYTSCLTKLYAYSASVQNINSLPEVSNTRFQLNSPLLVNGQVSRPKVELQLFGRDPNGNTTAKKQFFFIWLLEDILVNGNTNTNIIGYYVFDMERSFTDRGITVPSPIATDPSYEKYIGGRAIDIFANRSYRVVIFPVTFDSTIKIALFKRRQLTYWKDYETDFNGALKAGVDQDAILNSVGHCTINSIPVRNYAEFGTEYQSLFAYNNSNINPIGRWPSENLRVYNFTPTFGNQILRIDVSCRGQVTGRPPQVTSLSDVYSPCTIT